MGKIPSTGKCPQRRIKPPTLWAASPNSTNELFRPPSVGVTGQQSLGPLCQLPRRRKKSLCPMNTDKDRLHKSRVALLYICIRYGFHVGIPRIISVLFVLLVGCLTSQQQASVSQGRICLDNFTCCHTEIEVADQTFYLTQSQYTDTGPTSPSADPITPGAWQGSHWSANF